MNPHRPCCDCAECANAHVIAHEFLTDLDAGLISAGPFTTPQPSTEDTVTDLKLPEPGTRVLIIRGTFADRYGTVADPADAGKYPDDPCGRVFVILDGHNSSVSPLLSDIRPDALAVLEHVEQPMPTPNGHVSIQSLVRADLEAREQVGIQRYGTTLQPNNGRDALRDAYEEALDLACYLKQAMVERDSAHTVTNWGPRVWLPGSPEPTDVDAVWDGTHEFVRNQGTAGGWMRKNARGVIEAERLWDWSEIAYVCAVAEVQR